jgi:hypothetical protein
LAIGLDSRLHELLGLRGHFRAQLGFIFGILSISSITAVALQ